VATKSAAGLRGNQLVNRITCFNDNMNKDLIIQSKFMTVVVYTIRKTSGSKVVRYYNLRPVRMSTLLFLKRQDDLCRKV
jgi:hypothetical protein